MFALPPLGNESAHDAIRWADWVELNLLMRETTSLSIAEVAGELADIPPDDADNSERRVEGFWDFAEGRTESAFIELRQRADLLGDRYALEVVSDVATLRESAPSLDIYRFLILLRARQLYPGALQDDGVESGRLFEELTKHAFGAYAGSGHRHRVRFGLAGGSRGDGLPQSLDNAVERLSTRMSEQLGEVTSSDQGDYRADAVVWKPFHDRRPGQIVLIGQATISEREWVNKEPSNKWIGGQPSDRRLIRFVARPLTAVAFPETLSLAPPGVLEGRTFSSIPFDRLRLFDVLQEESLPSSLLWDIQAWVDEVGARLPR